MANILFLVSDAAMINYAKEVLAPGYPDIELKTAFHRSAVKLLPNHIAQGLEVVAARAGTALAIKQAQLNISVVEIPITSFDIIREVNEANLYGKNIAIVTYSTMILGVDSLTEIIDAKIWQYTMLYGQDYEAAVLEAVASGAEVILGGARVVKAAKRLSIPCALIKVGKESLLQAAREAKQIQQALEIEAAKRGFLSSILDYAYDGIVTIDKEQNITALNPAAQNLTRISKTKALGLPIKKIMPQLQLEKTFHTKQDDMHRIIDINGVRIMCNKVPIVVNGKSFGAVATFQEISKIQQMEAKIRQEIYARGHFAKFNFEDVVGESPEIKSAIETAKNFAATNFNILILGETGTGKEVFAQSIHNESKRPKGPFVAINCAALPAHILESELFGYVGGAFTGANKEGKPGLFEVAHGGTIFLDEIAEMDYVNQGRLLHVLQERTVVRLGSYKVLPIDVRVIAATNKDLDLLVRENKFRDDLYYRLNVLSLELPPLRARKKDIRLYTETFLREFSIDAGRNFNLNRDAMQLLEEYPWPGNIRELRNLMQRIAATVKTDTISGASLQGMFRQRTRSTETVATPKEERLASEIKAALAASKGNYSAAAGILGIHRLTLRRRMKKLQIEEY
ncbi:MAG: sigma 54-interacting transcriptional regulator [Sporomusaceae bacterium]|nr:sigma 54-interacting transcriptional regulator [Sporomusaceae bacterium]